QAEDGIRDGHVTGVQTCALPILRVTVERVGLPDAFHGHTHPERAETSILYHNLGGNRFEDLTRRVGLLDSSWSGDATVIDVNDEIGRASCREREQGSRLDVESDT